mmetsp:Transcript_13723/g.24198  ORF Transcript_13723/g.24198 Transcript_13723/m.24198 type:complete len:228 (+) Transcript_13723:142-825(+)
MLARHMPVSAGREHVSELVEEVAAVVVVVVVMVGGEEEFTSSKYPSVMSETPEEVEDESADGGDDEVVKEAVVDAEPDPMVIDGTSLRIVDVAVDGSADPVTIGVVPLVTVLVLPTVALVNGIVAVVFLELFVLVTLFALDELFGFVVPFVFACVALVRLLSVPLLVFVLVELLDLSNRFEIVSRADVKRSVKFVRRDPSSLARFCNRAPPPIVIVLLLLLFAGVVD